MCDYVYMQWGRNETFLREYLFNKHALKLWIFSQKYKSNPQIRE